jgi:hypothetical protein
MYGVCCTAPAFLADPLPEKDSVLKSLSPVLEFSEEVHCENQYLFSERRDTYMT